MQDVNCLSYSLFKIFCFFIHFTEIHVRLPEKVVAKLLNITIGSNRIEVTNRVDNPSTTLLCGNLFDKCKAEDATWTITDKHKLTIQIGLLLWLLLTNDAYS